MIASRTKPPTSDDLMQQIADRVSGAGITVAVAESLTGGNVSAALSAMHDASSWFRGGIVAYAEEVKFQLLGVDRGPVISARAARQMAMGAARLMGTDIAVATTGAGGPGPQENKPQGTVYVAVSTPEDCRVQAYHLDGDPTQIVAETTRRALIDLCRAIGRLDTAASG